MADLGEELSGLHLLKSKRLNNQLPGTGARASTFIKIGAQKDLYASL
jgi:hypothetical protein